MVSRCLPIFVYLKISLFTRLIWFSITANLLTGQGKVYNFLKEGTTTLQREIAPGKKSPPPQFFPFKNKIESRVSTSLPTSPIGLNYHYLENFHSNVFFYHINPQHLFFISYKKFVCVIFQMQYEENH